MSGYGTLENKPPIVEDPPEPIGKLKPLPAVNIPLGLQHSEGGIANEDHLRELYGIGQRDSSKAGWSAADYNNLACAIIWLHKEKKEAEAISYFEKALALQSPGPTNEEGQAIRCNLELVKAPSQAG